VIRDRLAEYLGPNTARNAIKTFSEKSLGLPSDKVTRLDAARLVEALRPMLKTLVGAAKAEQIVTQLLVELELRS
jgi:hypothetical protein